MKLPPAGSLVLIRWVDAVSIGSAWRPQSEVETDQLSNCRSVGWVLSANSTRIVLASSEVTARDADEPSVQGGATIPTGCITNIKQLR